MGRRYANTELMRSAAGFEEAEAFLEDIYVAGWLGVVDSHSIIGEGGILTHERASRNGGVTSNVGQRCSRVIERWFGKRMMGLVRGPAGNRHLRILILCVCGPVVNADKSLSDLKNIVAQYVFHYNFSLYLLITSHRNSVDAILAFSRELITPQIVYQALAAFAVNSFTMHNLKDDEPWKRVVTALEAAFAGERTLLEHTPVVLLTKIHDGVECRAYA